MRQKTTATEREKMTTFTDMAGTVNRAPTSYASYVTARRAVAHMEEALHSDWGDLPRVMFVPRESDGRIVVVVLDADSHRVPFSLFLTRGFLVVG